MKKPESPERVDEILLMAREMFIRRYGQREAYETWRDVANDAVDAARTFFDVADAEWAERSSPEGVRCG